MSSLIEGRVGEVDGKSGNAWKPSVAKPWPLLPQTRRNVDLEVVLVVWQDKNVKKRLQGPPRRAPSCLLVAFH